LSDKRAEILAWLDEELGALNIAAYLDALEGLNVRPAVRALRAEVEAHKEAKLSDGRGLGYCDMCGEDGAGTPTDWPCPAIERIHAATVGAA
jgi:hypothetical protein